MGGGGVDHLVAIMDGQVHPFQANCTVETPNGGKFRVDKCNNRFEVTNFLKQREYYPWGGVKRNTIGKVNDAFENAAGFLDCEKEVLMKLVLKKQLPC